MSDSDAVKTETTATELSSSSSPAPAAESAKTENVSSQTSHTESSSSSSTSTSSSSTSSSVSVPIVSSITPAESVDPSLAAKILRQVEFYFSNSNLPKDAFLKGLYDSDPDNWVSIPIIASFKRMREYTDSLPIIVASLRSSTSLKLSSDFTRVTRIDPLPENINTTKATIHVTGFPTDGIKWEDIRDFFEKDGKVQCVRLRKGNDKQLNGEAFVEFESPEIAAKVAAEPTRIYTVPSASSASTDGAAKTEEEAKTEPVTVTLTIQTKVDFFRKAKAEEEEKRAAAGGGVGSAGKEKREKGNKRKNAEQSKESTTEYSDKSQKKQKNNKEGEGGDDDEAGEGGEEEEGDEESKSAEKEPRVFKPDLLVYFDTVSDTSSRESLKDYLSSVEALVAYADFSKGEKKAVVRLSDDSMITATQAVEKLKEKKTLLDGIEPQMRVLTGEEEQKYWEGVWEKQGKSKETRAKGGRGGGKGGRGGGRGFRGRGGRGGRGRGGRGGRGRGGRN